MFNPIKFLLILIFWIVSNNFIFSTALKNVHITSPGRVKTGDNIILTCNYDLEGENISSVKWYKGVREIYRFSKNSENDNVIIFNTRSSSLVLSLVQQRDSGHYTCEVSADGPSFARAMGHVELKVSAEVLSEVHVTVPRYVQSGDSAVLKCDYDVGQETLYSVKWYKDNEEFYRFTPKEEQSRRKFPVIGINVDITRSDKNTVTLTSLQKDSSGQYICEVSTDAPRFHEEQDIAVLEVIVSAEVLSEVHVTVPRYVQSGDGVVLKCDYDVGRETLYSVKWYKDNKEFYRFTPKEEQSRQKFPVIGINVDLTRSDNNTVTLTSLQKDSSGQYICEVSTDAPRFNVKQDIAILEVIDVPKTKPEISFDDLIYKVGDFLDTNCTIHSFQPAVNLTWLINGREFWMDKATGNVYYHISAESHSTLPNVDRFIAGRISLTFNEFFITLNLKLILQPKYFEVEQINLGCRAKIYDIYERTTEKNIRLERSQDRVDNLTQVHWA